MFKTIIREKINMQPSKLVSNIQIDSIVAIICSILCAPNIICVIGVVGVIIVGLMSVYYWLQKNRLQYYQMRGLFMRFTHFTTSQKHFHCKINNNRWHCANLNNYCGLGQQLLSTMRINMPVMMLGMYRQFVTIFLFQKFNLNTLEANFYPIFERLIGRIAQKRREKKTSAIVR